MGCANGWRNLQSWCSPQSPNALAVVADAIVFLHGGFKSEVQHLQPIMVSRCKEHSIQRFRQDQPEDFVTLASLVQQCRVHGMAQVFGNWRRAYLRSASDRFWFVGWTAATGRDVELVDSKTGRSVNASSDDRFRRWPRTGDPGHLRLFTLLGRRAA
jgi:hypothetical protein